MLFARTTAYLQVRAALALEAQRFVDVEGYHFAARVLHHEVADGSHGNLASGPRDVPGGELRVALGDLTSRRLLQQIDEIVGLHAEPLAAGHLDKRLAGVFRRRRVPIALAVACDSATISYEK